MIRGVETCNPGNLRAARRGPWWRGQIGIDKHGMCVFSSPEAGFRALAKTIQRYQAPAEQGGHDCDTLRKIISRYAPPDPGGDNNDTEAYINDVAARINVKPDDVVYFSAPLAMTDLCRAICIHENGLQPYAVAVLSNGVTAAFA